MKSKVVSAVETYFRSLRKIYTSGGSTREMSSYAPLAGLIDAIGESIDAKVFCVGNLADQGAGHPDFGLYSHRQIQRGQPRAGQVPERGVVEVKSLSDDAWTTARSDQVSRYWERYRLVLVTNQRDFVLLGEDEFGGLLKLEVFRLATDKSEFLRKIEKPRSYAREVGVGLSEYLARVLVHRATITEPKDLAWLLASYARDGLSRVQAAGDSASLDTVRSALEGGLGVRFKGEKGVRFFRSTLIQTLFYGVFSAWVLWVRQSPTPTEDFNWRTAVWHLRAPVLRALFQQLSDPGRLKSLGLVELLDWTGAALGRVNRRGFFSRFVHGEAVSYFYEPFLQAFDPVLRKQLGVWYTPSEVVRYMVTCVDKALKEDLGIRDGLAAENVYVLDPCCGTGAFLAEALRRISINLNERGLGALVGARIKEAATKRVFGFEIMPAPFVVAHLQVDLTMQELDATLSHDGAERPCVYLTNALTGWEPGTTKPLPFPELEEERDRAERVKRETPILVILGNPPYDGFAVVAVEEEKDLSESYRTTKRVRRPEGRGLNDPYVRFFRMAERRIAEKTGQGVICLISNYSWLDGQSFTGMRERYLDTFDVIRIDCLNGDKYKTGKVGPDGLPDPSIFSTEGNPIGIQVGTAITTLVRKVDHKPTDKVSFRSVWGQKKREGLAAEAQGERDIHYETIEPVLSLGLPFQETEVTQAWFDWPLLFDLFPAFFPGVLTKRDSFLVDIDLDRLKNRVADYFNPNLSHDEIGRRYPAAMKSSSGFVVTNARSVRDSLLARGGPMEAGYVRFSYRPFDNRWLYWEPGHGLLGRPVPDYPHHVFEGNVWLVLQKKARPVLSAPLVTSRLGDLNQMNSGVYCVPAFLCDDVMKAGEGPNSTHPNLSSTAQLYLERLNVSAEDLFYHVVSVLHDPSYHQAHADALRAEGPRIPLPGWLGGEGEDAAAALISSACRGREIANNLGSEERITGLTQAPLRPGVSTIAVPATASGRNMRNGDFLVTAGWGYRGKDGAVMPGHGRVIERPFTPAEVLELKDTKLELGETTLDIYLNSTAFWRNVPVAIWNYKLGGYQVLKKWLSYRQREILKRPLKDSEIQEFCDIARRIMCLLTA